MKSAVPPVEASTGIFRTEVGNPGIAGETSYIFPVL